MTTTIETAAQTPTQARTADALAAAGYATTFIDSGHGQVELLAAHPDEIGSLLAIGRDFATFSTRFHWVHIRWQDGRFYDAEVNYDMDGSRMYRSIRAALDEVIW